MVKVYDPEIFAGTAYYYSRYRFPYPQELFDYILNAFPPRSSEQVLDLGCGTGQLAVPLSKHFTKVVCADPDPEMLAETARIVAENGLNNMQILKASSGDIHSLPNTFGLVTMGESFHWMDRHQVLQDAFNILVAGGGVVIVSRKIQYPAGFQEIIDAVIKQYLGERRRAGTGFYSHPRERHESVLSKSPFQEMEPWIHKYQVGSNISNLIGFLHSTSYAAKRLLGDSVEDFGNTLRTRILSEYGKEEFTVSMTITAYSGRKNL